MEKIFEFLANIPIDKLLHFAVGSLIACVAILLQLPVFIAFVCVVVISLLKEIYDNVHKDKHEASSIDSIATILGGCVVLLPVAITQLFN